MEFIPVMWSVWGASVVLMIGVSIYMARLGRNEENQLFLAESSSHVKSEQDDIAARVKKFQPVKRTALALAGAMTLLVLIHCILYASRLLK